MIKRVINTNISLADAFTSMIEQSVAGILIQKGIENGDDSPITDLGDVKKKGGISEVLSVNDVFVKIKNNNGEIIDVSCFFGFNYYELKKGDVVAYDWDSNGNAYLIKSDNPANKIEIKAIENINIQVGDDNKGRLQLNTANDGNGGLVKIKELTDKLNALTDAVRELELKYNLHTHATSVVAVNAVPTTATSTSVNTLPIFDKNQYENKNVTH